MTDAARRRSAARPAGAGEPEIHHTHRDVNGGWLRPAVFGAMDGVISNGALVAGVAGAHTSTHDVILSGFAGLLAGSFSMAVGEWTSVQSQAQLVQAEIEKERAEIERAPHAEEAELAAMFRHRGPVARAARQGRARAVEGPGRGLADPRPRGARRRPRRAAVAVRRRRARRSSRSRSARSCRCCPTCSAPPACSGRSLLGAVVLLGDGRRGRPVHRAARCWVGALRQLALGGGHGRGGLRGRDTRSAPAFPDSDPGRSL